MVMEMKGAGEELCHRGPYPLKKSLLLTLLCFHLHNNSSLCKNFVMETIRSSLEGAARVFTHSPHAENVQKLTEILREFCILPCSEAGPLSSLTSSLFVELKSEAFSADLSIREPISFF